MNSLESVGKYESIAGFGAPLTTVDLTEEVLNLDESLPVVTMNDERNRFYRFYKNSRKSRSKCF